MLSLHTPTPFSSPVFFKTRQFQFGQILLEVILFRPCSFHLLNTLHFFGSAMLRTRNSRRSVRAGKTVQTASPARRSYPPVRRPSVRIAFCPSTTPLPHTQLALHCSPQFLPAALLPTAACAAAAVRPCSGRARLVLLTAHQHSAFHSVSNPHPLLRCAWSPSKFSVTCKPSTAFSLAYRPNH